MNAKHALLVDGLGACASVLLLGFVLLLLAPIVLVSTFLLSILPGADEATEKCER